MDKTKIFKHLLTLILFLGYLTLNGQASLSGTVVEEKSGESIPFADVILYLNEMLITGTQTDFDGNYHLSGLMPGTYDIEARFLGYATVRKTGVALKNETIQQFDLQLQEEGILCCGTGCGPYYKIPLIDIDNMFSGKIFGSDEIKRMAVTR